MKQISIIVKRVLIESLSVSRLLMVSCQRSVQKMRHNVSICVRAGLPKLRPVPDSERTKDTKTLDYASTPLDANTLLAAGRLEDRNLFRSPSRLKVNCRLLRCHCFVF